jgi:hypothetical protein
LSGLLCCGPRKGKQQTFVLLDEWLPSTIVILLAKRHWPTLRSGTSPSHGPATLEDFAWWIGMKKSDAQAALDTITPRLSRVTSEGRTFWLNPTMPSTSTGSAGLHLLPSFDELLLGYTDRSNSLLPSTPAKSRPAQTECLCPSLSKAVESWARGSAR